MAKRWDYRYEMIDFHREKDGIVSCQSRSEGQIPYRDNFRSTRLLFEAWKTARDLAERTQRDVVVYVRGNRIIPRVRTVNSSSFY